MSTYTYKQALDRAFRRGGRAYANVLNAIIQHSGMKASQLSARIWGTNIDPHTGREVAKMPSRLSIYTTGRFVPRANIHKKILSALPNGSLTLSIGDLTGDEMVEERAEARVIEDRIDNGLVRLVLDAPMHRYQALAILDFLARAKNAPEAYLKANEAHFNKLANEPSLALSSRWDIQLAKGGPAMADPQCKIADTTVEVSITEALDPDDL